jgi:hypothetical protein
MAYYLSVEDHIAVPYMFVIVTVELARDWTFLFFL